MISDENLTPEQLEMGKKIAAEANELSNEMLVWLRTKYPEHGQHQMPMIMHAISCLLGSLLGYASVSEEHTAKGLILVHQTIQAHAYDANEKHRNAR